MRGGNDYYSFEAYYDDDVRVKNPDLYEEVVFDYLNVRDNYSREEEEDVFQAVCGQNVMGAVGFSFFCEDRKLGLLLNCEMTSANAYRCCVDSHGCQDEHDKY